LNTLFVADVSIARVIGGAERFLYEQTTRMSQRGHDIHLLTRRLPKHDGDHEVVNGVNEWRYDCNQSDPAAFIKTTWFNAKRLFECLHAKYHFDCINFHQPFSALGINNSKTGRGIPKFYTCHSLSFEEFASRNGNQKGIFQKAQHFFQIQARKRIEKSGLNKSNEIVVLSQFTADKLVDTYNISRSKIRKIPGGVDLNRFHQVDDKLAIRRTLNIPRDKVVFFTVRNLVQRMGLDNLISAINELIKLSTDVYLVIGGEGALERELVDLTKKLDIEDRIHFVGFIPDDRLPLYYQMADLFVLPTRALEGFGLVTLEAMACGLPVVGTPVGGTQEILGQFDTGYLFEDTHSDSIAKLALEKYQIIKNDPLRWKQISNRCRQFVETRYSWERNVDALENLFLSHI
jgi:glycosyltransferase involved in cell wall biosynthesis